MIYKKNFKFYSTQIKFSNKIIEKFQLTKYLSFKPIRGKFEAKIGITLNGQPSTFLRITSKANREEGYYLS